MRILARVLRTATQRDLVAPTLNLLLHHQPICATGGLRRPVPWLVVPCRMVEGHQCHRVAHVHRKLLLKKKFVAASPNARFTDGAAAITGKPLQRIEVHGKNLFYFWTHDERVAGMDLIQPDSAPADLTDIIVLHVHFGMSGRFSAAVGPAPEVRPTTRLALVNQEHNLVAHLSAMTVKHGGLEYYFSERAKLGHDPLREDADADALWERIKDSKKPIGGVLMDQTLIAGVGNIYRAEILFKAGVHPEAPACTLERADFDRVWRHSVLLLQRGFKTGSILTVDPEEAAKLGDPWKRRYIYNQALCGRCGSKASTWEMAARRVYACQTCQPLPQDTVISPARVKALAASTPTKKFLSHCAPDDPTAMAPEQMSVPLLRKALKGCGLAAAGNKAALVAELTAALAAEAAQAAVDMPAVKSKGKATRGQAKAGSKAADSQPATPATPAQKQPARRQRVKAEAGASAAAGNAAAAALALESRLETAGQPAAVFVEGGLLAGAEGAAIAEAPPVQPGTGGLGEVASPSEAAQEKRRAGENRAVEHVALDGDAAAGEPTKPAAKRGRRQPKQAAVKSGDSNDGTAGTGAEAAKPAKRTRRQRQQ